MGLAAAAHVLERGHDADRAGSGTCRRTCRSPMADTCSCSRRGSTMSTRRQSAVAGRGMEFAGPAHLSDRRRIPGAVPRAARLKTALKDRHSHIQPRHRYQPRRFRQGQDHAAASDAPFEIRYQNGKDPRAFSADAVIDASGTWSSPNPGRQQRLASDWERDRPKDRLRHAGHTAEGAQPLSRQDRCCARRRSFSHRDVDRTCGPENECAGRAGDLVAAGQRSSESLRRRRQRQTRGPRRTRLGIRRAGRDPAKSGSKLVLRYACRPRMESCASVPALPAAGAKLSSTNWSWRPASVPDFGFVSELRMRLDPAIEAPVALAPLIDPNEHSCGTVRPHGARELAQDEPGFYFAGIKSYGRAPTFLMIPVTNRCVRSPPTSPAIGRRPNGSNWYCPRPAFVREPVLKTERQDAAAGRHRRCRSLLCAGR